MKTTHIAVVAVSVTVAVVLWALTFGSYRLAALDLPESERLEALARIAANVITSAAPQESTAHIRLVQASPHANIVEAEFLVDAVTAQLFQTPRITEIETAVIYKMCLSNLKSGFRRGLIIHSIYSTVQGSTLADFKVDKVACSTVLPTPFDKGD